MDQTFTGAASPAPPTETDNSESVDLEMRPPPRLRRCQANLQQVLANITRSLSGSPQVSPPPIAPSASLNKTTARNLDSGTIPTSHSRARWTSPLLSRTRSQYYEKKFAQREPINKAKEMVVKNTLITAHVMINFPLEGPYASFPSDLALHLSEVYQWPSSCIMVTVSNHAILINNMIDPAYHITLSAIPAEIGPAKNKRSAHMVQHFIAQRLDVPIDRGVMRFVAVGEDNMATNAVTTLQEIEDYESETSSQNGSTFKGKDKYQDARKTHATASSERSISADTNAPVHVRAEGREVDDEDSDRRLTEQTKAPKVKARKSVMSLFRR